MYLVSPSDLVSPFSSSVVVLHCLQQATNRWSAKPESQKKRKENTIRRDFNKGHGFVFQEPEAAAKPPASNLPGLVPWFEGMAINHPLFWKSGDKASETNMKSEDCDVDKMAWLMDFIANPRGTEYRSHTKRFRDSVEMLTTQTWRTTSAKKYLAGFHPDKSKSDQV